jgi:hypothetical protein
MQTQDKHGTARISALDQATHGVRDHLPTGSRDPWGSRAGKRMTIAAEFGANPHRYSIESKAYMNQLQKKCPFASDRRFLGGEWLFKSSALHKSEALPNKHYTQGKEHYHAS